MPKYESNNFTCDESLYCDEFNMKDEKDDRHGLQSDSSKRCVNPRQTGIAYRRRMKRQKRNRLMKIINRGGYPAAGYIDYDFIDGKAVQTGKYIKYPKNSNQQKFFKRYSNSVVRRKELPIKGNGYRKCFDYRWSVD